MKGLKVNIEFILICAIVYVGFDLPWFAILTKLKGLEWPTIFLYAFCSLGAVMCYLSYNIWRKVPWACHLVGSIIKDDEGVMRAVIDNDIPRLKTLLELYKFRCTAGDNYAIRAAAARGYADIVKLLLENGADCTDDDNYAIQIASEKGHTEIVKLLLEAGADCTANDNWAVRRAAECGHTDVVKLLLEAGADCTARGNRAIQIASEKGYTDIVELLKQYGASL